MTSSTKIIDTKYKEIYYSPVLENSSNNDDRTSDLVFMMNLMAFQNLELVTRIR